MIDRDKPEIIMWPDDPPDGIAEPPITFKRYSDAVELRQGKKKILVQYHAIPEMIRALKEIAKDGPG